MPIQKLTPIQERAKEKTTTHLSPPRRNKHAFSHTHKKKTAIGFFCPVAVFLQIQV